MEDARARKANDPGQRDETRYNPKTQRKTSKMGSGADERKPPVRFVCRRVPLRNFTAQELV